MSEPDPTYTTTVPGIDVRFVPPPDPLREYLETRHRALMMELHEVRRQLGLPKLNERKR